MRRVTLAPAGWYELLGDVQNTPETMRWVLNEGPSEKAQALLEHGLVAVAAFDRIRPGQPVLLTDREHAALTALVAEHLQHAEFWLDKPLHPDLVEPYQRRLLVWHALRDELLHTSVVEEPAS